MNHQSLFKIAGCGAAALALLASGAAAQAQVFTETFGNDPERVSSTYVPSNFIFAASGAIPDGRYAIMPPQNITGSTGGVYWDDLAADHTGDTGGALMVLNAGAAAGEEFYVRDFGLAPGQSYRVSAWRYVVNANLPSGNPISWSLTVRNTADQDPAEVSSGPVVSTATREWIETTLDFAVPANCITVSGSVPAQLALANQSPVVSGNDFYIDDISVQSIPPVPDLPEFCPTGLAPTPPTPPTPVPTLDLAGLGLLSLLGAGAGALGLRRRRAR